MKDPQSSAENMCTGILANPNLNFNLSAEYLVKGKGIFSVSAPQYVMRPPVTEHVPLHSKLLCKNIARASGGCK